MPCCVVKGCPTSWRKKDPLVNLHTFPWDPSRITIWLQQTGQYSANLPEMVQKILNGKVNDTYRMCSLHFSHDAYHYYHDRRALRKDAIPTIFSSTTAHTPQLMGGHRQDTSNQSSDSPTLIGQTGPTLTSTTTVVSYSIANTQNLGCTTTSQTPIDCGLNTKTFSPKPQSTTIFMDTQYKSMFEIPANFTSLHPPTTNFAAEVHQFSDLIPKQIVTPSNLPDTALQLSNSSTIIREPTVYAGKRDYATNTLPSYFLRDKKVQTQIQRCNKKIMCTLTRSPKRLRHRPVKRKRPCVYTDTDESSGVDFPIGTLAKKKQVKNVSPKRSNPGNDSHICPSKAKNSTTTSSTRPSETLPSSSFTLSHDSLIFPNISKPVGLQSLEKNQEKTCSVELLGNNCVDNEHSFSGHKEKDYSQSVNETTLVVLPSSSKSCSSSESIFSTASDPNDPSFHESDCEEVDDDSRISFGSKDLLTLCDFEDLAPSSTSVVNQEKYIVFESCLKKLIRLIPCPARPKCFAALEKFKKTKKGSALKIEVCCTNGHRRYLWDSQPTLAKFSAGNILLSSSIVLSGNSYRKVACLMKLLNVAFISNTTFCKHQRTFIFKGIDNAWKKEQNIVLEQMRQTPAILSGDGQCDSPGYSAKYCTYTLMDGVSKKICAFQVEQVIASVSSVALEKIALQRCLQELQEKNICIGILATDRHVSIRKMLREQYPHIKHQFDVWHIAKSVGNKLLTASKAKNKAVLSSWIQPLKTHLWWCARTCGKNEDVLIERWLSLLKHVINVHSWVNAEGNTVECLHPPLTQEQLVETKWLTPHQPAHTTLCEIVNHPKLVKDIRQLSAFCHTGELEIFHSLCLKYKPKRIHFYLDSMVARTQLAALDHNHNLGRNRAIVRQSTSYGDPVGTVRHRIEYSKGRRDWVVKVLYEPTSQNYLCDVMEEVVQVVTKQTNSSWLSRQVTLPQNAAPLPRPDKTELVSNFLSRFG